MKGWSTLRCLHKASCTIDNRHRDNPGPVKWVVSYPIDNTPALVLAMAQCLIGVKLLTKTSTTHFVDAYKCNQP